MQRGRVAFVVVAPFAVFAVAALAAGLHRWLGSPLGDAATAKMADVAQTLALMLVAYAPAVVAHQRAAKRGGGLDDADRHEG